MDAAESGETADRAPATPIHRAGPTTLVDAWPLFGLRIRTEHLVLRVPSDDDLTELIDLARAGIHPPDEMPFGVASSTLPSPRFERGVVQHFWGQRAGWTPEAWELNLLVELDGRAIGAQSIHAREFAVYRTIDSGSWLGRAFQGRGLGKEMRHAVLAFAFDGLGAHVAESGAFLDNMASAGVSRALGYEENGRGFLAPEGVPREIQRFRMTRDLWASRPRPQVSIEGLDACRDLFGSGAIPEGSTSEES